MFCPTLSIVHPSLCKVIIFFTSSTTKRMCQVLHYMAKNIRCIWFTFKTVYCGTTSTMASKVFDWLTPYQFSLGRYLATFDKNLLQIQLYIKYYRIPLMAVSDWLKYFCHLFLDHWKIIDKRSLQGQHWNSVRY